MSSTIRPLIQATYEQVSEDTKLVRLTTITKLIHSVFFLFFMGTNIYRVIIRLVQGSEAANMTSWWITQVLQWITETFPLSEYGGMLLIVAIMLVIWYYLFPPIGEWALIAYLADEEKKWSSALISWFTHFFKMFEYRSMTSLFSPLFFMIFLSRFWVMDVIDNWLVSWVLILWWSIMLFTMIFFSFSQYFIVLEWAKPIEAISKSIQLSMSNMWQVLKTVILEFILWISFVINIVLFFGLPLLIFYAWIQFGGEMNGLLGTILVVVATVVGFLLSYVNGIIESFFITLRYRLFVYLRE